MDPSTITSPRPFQVIQASPGPLPSARVTLERPGASARARITGRGGFTTPWQDFAPGRAVFDLPAGGWYSADFEDRGAPSAPFRSAPFGVGDVFLVAGQSYAANCNEARLRVRDPEERVAAMDPVTGAWRIAHDPQPSVPQETHDGGTAWPAAMDLLVARSGAPVGTANVAVAATSSAQWLPGTPLFANLVRAARLLGGARAVLWQQGESDVIERTPADVYVRRITEIRTALDAAVGAKIPWLLAKSTLHPYVYDDPAQESVIRGAVDELLRAPGFFPGPDTDTLRGENRADKAAGEHFSAVGQQRAGELWFEALWRFLAANGPSKANGQAARPDGLSPR